MQLPAVRAKLHIFQTTVANAFLGPSSKGNRPLAKVGRGEGKQYLAYGTHLCGKLRIKTLYNHPEVVLKSMLKFVCLVILSTRAD